MKFAEHLSAHITPEWRKQYIAYETMKEMLYEALEEAPSPEMTDRETIHRYFARFDETFFQYCDKELLTINTFFSEKLAEANRKFASLQADLEAAKPHQVKHRSNVRARFPITIKTVSSEQDMRLRTLHDLKLAFSEFYLGLILLQNYQTLNFTGFRKILKKHDKLLETDRGAHWREASVETAPFYNSKRVDHLIKETEGVFTNKLEGGDRQKAMKRLRVPPLGEKQNPWTTFRVGLFSGLFLVIAVVVIIAAVYTDHESEWHGALHMYRGFFLVFLAMFLVGINTYGWRSCGVNHVLIFELDPRDHLTHQNFLELAAFLAVIWGLSLTCYMFSNVLGILLYVHPVWLFGFCVIFLFNPIRVLHFRARRWLLKVLFRIVTAPFHHVGFADFWLADQLNSLTIVLLDLEFFICYYAIEVDWLGAKQQEGICGHVSYGVRPIVACLPAWFRFAQCLRRYRDTRKVFPHIVNAGKYSTTFFVVIFSTLNTVYKGQHGDEVTQNNAFFYLWVAAAFVSTCYTMVWDFKMDWGLLDRNAGENTLLREEIVYGYKAYYYFALVENFVLRFAWTITISVGEAGMMKDEVLMSVLASCEVLRRFIWNFFRLENEHLNNCGQFRAVRDISIAPIQANDQTLLEEMMDKDDGVSNRHGKDDREKLVQPQKTSKSDSDRLPDSDELQDSNEFKFD